MIGSFADVCDAVCLLEGMDSTDVSPAAYTACAGAHEFSPGCIYGAGGMNRYFVWPLAHGMFRLAISRRHCWEPTTAFVQAVKDLDIEWFS